MYTFSVKALTSEEGRTLKIYNEEEIHFYLIYMSESNILAEVN